MSLAKLSYREKQIILQCLNTVWRGGFFGADFQTRLGIEPEELAQIIAMFPDIDDFVDSSNTTLAINNCLNELCHGIKLTDRDWQRWLDASRAEVKEVYRKWVIERGWSQTGIR